MIVCTKDRPERVIRMSKKQKQGYDTDHDGNLGSYLIMYLNS